MYKFLIGIMGAVLLLFDYFIVDALTYHGWPSIFPTPTPKLESVSGVVGFAPPPNVLGMEDMLILLALIVIHLVIAMTMLHRHKPKFIDIKLG